MMVRETVKGAASGGGGYWWQHKSQQICSFSAGITNWQIMEIASPAQLGQVLLISCQIALDSE